MKAKEAKCLLVGTVVMWNNNPNDLGTVRKLNPCGFFVDWENGQDGWIDYHGAKNVSVR